MGVESSFCGSQFYSDSTDQCCKNESPVEIEEELHSEYTVMPNYFYAFGTDQVTIQQKWITSADDHYPTDLGLVPDNDFNSTHPYFRVMNQNILLL